MQITINNQTYQIPDEQSTRMLVWVLRDELGLSGTKFGCGMGICGSCVVHLDGAPIRSCVTPVSALEGKDIKTIEGLSQEQSNGEIELHPVQQAFLDTQTPQCGWCMSGQMMTVVALLEENASPSEEEVVEAMNRNYCRCGAYVRIKEAALRAVEIIAEESEQ
jgi:isoquinoline 1-oxidoreductase alpha subunit